MSFFTQILTPHSRIFRFGLGSPAFLSGVIPADKAQVRSLTLSHTLCQTALAHKNLGKLDLIIIAHMCLRCVQLLHSATPFDCREL